MIQTTSTIFVLLLATFTMAQLRLPSDSTNIQPKPNLNFQFKPEPQRGKFNGLGSFDGHGNGAANIGYQHPKGANGKLDYGHQNGYGHDIGVQGMVPIYRSPNERTTILGGGGVSGHIGGPTGTKITDKNIGLGLRYRF